MASRWFPEGIENEKNVEYEKPCGRRYHRFVFQKTVRDEGADLVKL
jgi:hypothetical protein